MRGDPFLGAALGFVAPLAKKAIGWGARKLTGGKLIGQGGGTIAAKKIAAGVAGATATYGAIKSLRPPALPGVGPIGRLAPGLGFRKKYKRMNAANPKALKRAMRRVKAFGKLASKAGYVKRQPRGGGARRKFCA